MILEIINYSVIIEWHIDIATWKHPSSILTWQSQYCGATGSRKAVTHYASIPRRCQFTSQWLLADGLGKAVQHGPNVWAFVTHTGKPDESPILWLQTVLSRLLQKIGEWISRWNPSISMSLSISELLPFKWKIKKS